MTLQTGNPKLIEIIRIEIETNGGRITFARFMELALYHPELGYYLQADRKPGRGGDFITAPEATPYFGLTLARQMAEFWERLGRPQRWKIREYGAGHGGLAYDIIAGLSDEFPDAAATLHYRLVEPNHQLIEQAMEAMQQVGLAGMVVPELLNSVDEELEPIVGVILANEVADALPVHRLTVRDGVVRERYVTWEAGQLREIEDVPTGDLIEQVESLSKQGIHFENGDCFEINLAAPCWFSSACQGLERGFAIVIDYGYLISNLYAAHRLNGTVRGYYEHTVTDDPFLRVGEQDLTAHVNFTGLIAAGETEGAKLAGFTTQGAMLASLGLGDRLVELQRDPDVIAADVFSARAVVLRLIDPGGLGRFGVLIMAKNVPIDDPLASFATAPPSF